MILATSTPARPLTALVRRRPLTSYFALAFALTWALVLPLTCSRNFGMGSALRPTRPGCPRALHPGILRRVGPGLVCH